MKGHKAGLKRFILPKGINDRIRTEVDVSESAAALRKRPIHLWIVGILSLLWNSFGAYDYLGMQLPIAGYLAQVPQAIVLLKDSYPVWMDAAWAIGVWGAMAGSIALLMAQRWAVWMFAASLTGLAVSSIYNFTHPVGMEAIGGGGVVMTAVIWIVAIALLWYSIRHSRLGVLR
jgi:hypothetical protein